jgi:hypothetical protein
MLDLSIKQLVTVRNYIVEGINAVKPWTELPAEHQMGSPERLAYLEELLSQVDEELELKRAHACQAEQS